MAKVISFHSYKGGTGKTTLAVNLSANLVTKGYNVLLIDMDVYAPSLYVYFNIQPKKWINDYLNDKIPFSDSIYDFSHVLKEFHLNTQINGSVGSFHTIFSNPSKQEITDLDSVMRKDSSKSQMLKKMLFLKKRVLQKQTMIISYWTQVQVYDIGQLIHWPFQILFFCP